MPRKRRKLSLTDRSADIPFSKVRVEWVDCVSDSGWATEKEFDKMKLSFPVNEGWLYEKTDKHIKMFASYDKDEDGITFGDRTMIPRAWVRKISQFLLFFCLCIILLPCLDWLQHLQQKRKNLSSTQPHVV